MDLDQLFVNFQYADLQWFIPVLAGLVIIAGALLIGIVRGMTAGVLVALFFGGVMSLSPVLLETLERRAGGMTPASAEVSRNLAELAQFNADFIAELSRVVASMRATLDGLTPMVSDAATAGGDATAAQAFNDSLADTQTQLDAATETLSRATLLRQRLDESMEGMNAQVGRPSGAR